MCDIYSKSVLTVSVPLCTDSSQSFLKKRLDQDQKVGFATISYIDEISKSKDSLSLINGTLSKTDASWFLEESWLRFSLASNYTGNRWLSRGWTFQEWMLSPRVLHIDTMTLWDCFDGYANELNRRYMEEPRLLRDLQRIGEGISWAFILFEYTSRDITYKKDRLPALSGLAARYSQITGHTYLAGLWFQEMPRSLLWQTLGHRMNKMSDDNDTAESKQALPSWSWASGDHHVYYQRDFEGEATSASAFLSAASLYRCSDPLSSDSTEKRFWIDIKGHISVVTDQYECERSCWVQAADHWWFSVSDRGSDYFSDDLAQSHIYLILLGSSSDGARSDDAWSDDNSTDGGNNGDANIDGTYSSGSCSVESSSDGSEREHLRHYGALVLKSCGLIDNRQCFRRLGIAYLYWGERLNVHDGPSWELQDIRLI